MIEDEVPQILGKVRVDACKDREKVCLEGLDGMFSGVATMDIRRDELELDVPLLLNDAPVFSTGLVVEDL